MAWDERHAVIFDVTIMPAPSVPVAAADTRRTDFYDHAILWRNWNWDILDFYRSTEFVVHTAHGNLHCELAAC